MAATYDAHPIENIIPLNMNIAPSQVDNAVRDIKAIYLKDKETFSKNLGALAHVSKYYFFYSIHKKIDWVIT